MGELQTQGNKAPAVYTGGEYKGVAADLAASDIQIPTLMLMQSNSTFVTESKGKIIAGDFLHSITREKWGNADEDTIELVFAYMFKTLVTSDVTGVKTWVRTQH